MYTIKNVTKQTTIELTHVTQEQAIGIAKDLLICNKHDLVCVFEDNKQVWNSFKDEVNND